MSVLTSYLGACEKYGFPRPSRSGKTVQECAVLIHVLVDIRLFMGHFKKPSYFIRTLDLCPLSLREITGDGKLVRENQVKLGINDVKAGINSAAKRCTFQMFNDSLFSHFQLGCLNREEPSSSPFISLVIPSSSCLIASPCWPLEE